MNVAAAVVALVGVVVSWSLAVPAAAGPTAPTGPIQRVSLGVGGSQADADSLTASISRNGRFVVFATNSSNLVPGDRNHRTDVFRRDRVTGSTVRVSIGRGGADSDGDSYAPSMSWDGRYVAFASNADNLVDGDTNRADDYFVRDLATGRTERVSVSSGGRQGDSFTFGGSISDGGRFVVFESFAESLVPGDRDRVMDVFWHDRETGATEQVSLGRLGAQPDGDSSWPTVSRDGRFVAFQSSASNLVADDTNASSDIFVRDRTAQLTTLVSAGTRGRSGGGNSYQPSLSSDGRSVAFDSFAADLVPGDTNSRSDVFVRDRTTGRTTRVSVGPGGRQGNGGSDLGSLSSDGRWVAFHSLADNLVPADRNGAADVFVRDLATGVTRRLSVSAGGAQGNAASTGPTVSGGGRFVSFVSLASNLVPGDTNGQEDAFVSRTNR